MSEEINHPLRLAIRRKACQRIRCTALADPSNKEGWLHGLIDFVAKHDRMPDAEEQAALKWTADRIRDNLQALPLAKPQPKVKGWITLGGSAAIPALRAFRDAMRGKAEREVFGELVSPPKSELRPDPYAEAMAAAPSRTAAQPDRSNLPDLPLSEGM
jgi:hypothetical protein